MTTAIAIFLTLYIGFLIALLIGWGKAMRQPSTIGQPDRALSATVVIAVRNEAATLGMLLNDLSKQSLSKWTAIVVDDHSSDNTLAIAREHARRDSRISVCASAGSGKKAALVTGIRQAVSPVIVTTDGDCRVPTGWLEQLCAVFQNDPDVALAFGGVRIIGENFFSQLQATEFLSLVGTGAAMAGLGYPVFCNGANLSFRKAAFEEVGGYEGSLHVPSGDDVFLLQKIVSSQVGKVRFISRSGSVVSTRAQQQWADLFHQRLRWAGKWRMSTTFISRVLALFVAGVQLSVLVLPFGMVWGADPWIQLSAVALWLSKAVFEFIFLRRVSRFVGTPWNWPAFLLLQLTYPFYAVGIGIISNFQKYQWKGRPSPSLDVSRG